MLAEAIVRLSRGRPDRRYSSDAPMLQPASMRGLHNWLRMQIAGQNMYHMLGQLGKHRQEARGSPVNLRDELFARPERIGDFSELVTAPNAGQIVPSGVHQGLIDILHRMHTALRNPEEHLSAYSPEHEIFEPTNAAMAHEMKDFDWDNLFWHLRHLDAPNRVFKTNDERNRFENLATQSGNLNHLFQLQKMIPFSPLQQSVPTRAQNALQPFLQHQQVRRNEISQALHQLHQPRQDRPNEMVPEDYYAL